jgi:hypothetical protein
VNYSWARRARSAACPASAMFPIYWSKHLFALLDHRPAPARRRCRGQGRDSPRERPRLASQGAGRLLWPILAGLLRLLVAVVGGSLVLRLTGSLPWVFAALSAGLVLYSVLLAGMVASGRGSGLLGTPAAVVSDVQSG